MLWAVDLRYPMRLAQVVIEAGANGVTNAAITVSNSTSALGAAGPDAVMCAANITVLQPNTPISSATVACDATGRYLTLTTTTPMDLCRCVGVGVQGRQAGVAAGVEASAMARLVAPSPLLPTPLPSLMPLAAYLSTLPPLTWRGTAPTRPHLSLGTW